MYHLNYSFSNSDIKAIKAALSVITAYDFLDDDEADMLSALSVSINLKLTSSKGLEQMSNRESYAIAFAIDSAYRSLKNEYKLDGESMAVLRDYIFTYNKLEPFFSPLLENVK